MIAIAGTLHSFEESVKAVYRNSVKPVCPVSDVVDEYEKKAET